MPGVQLVVVMAVFVFLRDLPTIDSCIRATRAAAFSLGVQRIAITTIRLHANDAPPHALAVGAGLRQLEPSNDSAGGRSQHKAKGPSRHLFGAQLF